MGKKRILPLILAVCALLMGCQETPAASTASTTTLPATVPTTTAKPTTPTTPQLCKANYLTALEVNFGGYFVTTVTVSYGESSLTQVYTVDGTTYQTTYDYQGRLLRQRMDGNKFWSEENFTYNPLSDKPETEIYTRKNYRRSITRTFDDNGNVLTTHFETSDGEWNTYTYTYDDQNRQLTEGYRSSGGSDTLLTYTYDAKGNIISEISLSKGKKNREVQRTYDEKGLLSRESVCRLNADGSLNYSSATDFTYDEKGNVLSQCQVDLDGYWSKLESTYTADGKLLTERTEDSDGYTAAKENVYDGNGHLIAGTETFGDSTYTYTYENDENGRWTRKTVTNPEGQVETTTRRFGGDGLLEQTTIDADGATEREVRTYINGSLQTYTVYRNDTVITECTYTYALAENLQPQEQTQLLQLMQTVFVEFMP